MAIDNSYAESLLNLDTIEDIEASLPSPLSNGYYEFLTDLIQYINNEIESNEELKKECRDREDIDSIDLELSKLNNVRNVLVSKFSKVHDAKDNEEHKKNIVFLMTNASNPCIEKDLKDIPWEYLEDLSELLEDLELFGSDAGKYNDLVCKKLTNNDDLKNVFELIAFKVRLYFEQFDKDTIIVVMATLKNQTNPKNIYDSLSRRLSMTAYDEKRNVTLIDKLKQQLSDSDTKQRLIEEHRKIRENILSKLKGNSK